MPQRGQELSIEQKRVIVKLKEAFDAERKAGVVTSTKDAVGRIARCLSIGRRSVERVLSEYNKTGTLAVMLSSKQL